ncbi:relaxase MobL (plasmid) [Macrococcoides canis]|uniref:MobP2 family relaxase n=1 Tax=Macrococcoides canis TaxID=1855823 RepID=UPI001F20DFC7|nr:MobP2 family relaxase [Macrococcus canis]UJS28995.1 relaxase MobL [Macrococcus canis]
MPAIILTSDFIAPSTEVRTKISQRKYANYIDYINRSEAKLQNDDKHTSLQVLDKQFDGYLEYLNRAKAKSKSIEDDILKSEYGLFDKYSNRLNREERLQITKQFDEAQKNGSVLWRDVYSFDNQWLEEQGYLKDGKLNEQIVKDAIRESMKVCFDEEKLNDTGIWVGEIHYNTDNIHVHVASVEKENTRPIIEYERYYKGELIKQSEPKGARKLKTESKMKSTFINHMTDRNLSLSRISDLRYELHHSIEIDKNSKDVDEKLKNIIRQLPDNKSKWQYNNKEIKHLQPLIDEYTNNYLNEYHKEKFDEYKDLLKKESEYHKKIYGNGEVETDRYKDSEKYKLKDLNAKMGNELLRELKNHLELNSKSHEDKKNFINQFDDFSKKQGQDTTYKSQPSNKKSDNKNRFKRKNLLHFNKRLARKLERAFHNEYKDSQLEYENQLLEQKIQREKDQMEL